MAFQRHRPFGAEQLHQLGGQDDRVDVVLLGVFGPLEHFGKAAPQRFEPMQVVAGHQRAQRRAADDQHFVRQRMEHWPQRAAGDGEAAKDHDDQNDYADCGVHGLLPPGMW